MDSVLPEQSWNIQFANSRWHVICLRPCYSMPYLLFKAVILRIHLDFLCLLEGYKIVCWPLAGTKVWFPTKALPSECKLQVNAAQQRTQWRQQYIYLIKFRDIYILVWISSIMKPYFKLYLTNNYFVLQEQ